MRVVVKRGVLGVADIFAPPVDEQKHDDGSGSQNGPHPPLPVNTRAVECGLVFRIHWHSVAGDEQAVGIYTVGGAGNERNEVLAWLTVERAGVRRLDDPNIVHLVLELLAAGGDVESIALLDLGEVVPQRGIL